MDSADIEVIKGRTGESLDGLLKSLHEISVIDNPRPGGKTHCLENKRAGKIEAIWFDELMARWTNLEQRRHDHLALAHRIDGCYVKGEDIFLIEFKADGDLDKFKDVFWMKFHDSFVQLLVHKWMSLENASQHLYYIVVTSTVFRYTDNDFSQDVFSGLSESEKSLKLMQMTNPIEGLVQKPWAHSEIVARCNLQMFEGVSCKKAMTITTSQFDRFVQEKHWV